VRRSRTRRTPSEPPASQSVCWPSRGSPVAHGRGPDRAGRALIRPHRKIPGAGPPCSAARKTVRRSSRHRLGLPLPPRPAGAGARPALPRPGHPNPPPPPAWPAPRFSPTRPMRAPIGIMGDQHDCSTMKSGSRGMHSLDNGRCRSRLSNSERTFRGFGRDDHGWRGPTGTASVPGILFGIARACEEGRRHPQASQADQVWRGLPRGFRYGLPNPAPRSQRGRLLNRRSATLLLPGVDFS
jgi:hypothetical protein